MSRQQLQPYKSELCTVFNRVCALVEKKTLELAIVRRERDEARLLSLVLVALLVVCGAVTLIAVTRT